MESDSELLIRWEKGDRDAGDEIVRRYSLRLLRVADRQIGAKFKRRFDGEDIIQSAFRTFFRRAKNGSYHLDPTTSLWKLLLTFTLNKMYDTIEHHNAQRRNPSREGSNADLLSHLVGREPTQEDAVALNEGIEVVWQSVQTDRERDVITLYLEGYDSPEIAHEINVSRQTALRIIKRVIERCRLRFSKA